MTVLSEKNKITYIGDSSQVLYPISFEFIDNLDIFVSIYNLDDSFVEDWVYSTQFVIENSNVRVVDGYQIDSTKKMLVRRIVDYVQDNKYREGGDFPAKSTETSFDKSTMLAQQLKEELGRCPKVDPIYNLNITLPMPNAGKALIWNDGEDGFKNSTVDVDHLEEVTKQYRDEAEAARDEAQGYASNAKASEDGAKSQADRAQGIADDFDANAIEKTNDFNQNATSKTNTFNSNYTSKLNSFNSNASEKQAQVDASAEEARKWAIGTQGERPEGSSKHWAEEAAKSAASVEGSTLKKIAYENSRTIECSGSVTVTLQNTDEVIRLNITNAATVSFNLSSLTFPKTVYTVQIYVVSPNGPKTISFSAVPSITWINNTVPDFSSGKHHWLVLRYQPFDNNVLMSDAGEVG